MLGIRTAWFEEVGGPPIGNKRASRGARIPTRLAKQTQRLISFRCASVFCGCSCLGLMDNVVTERAVSTLSRMS